MLFISSAAWARPRSSALSRTMAAYSSTFAAVGVICMSSIRYCWLEPSLYTPRTRIWSSTVTGSIVWPYANMANIVSKISRFCCI